MPFPIIIISAMLHHVLDILKNNCLLDFNRPVVLGVSGGADSLYMLYTLHEIGIPIVVAHYNHHLRKEADQEAELVQQWVTDIGLPFVFGERQTERGSNDHISEEIARQKRYEFLFHAAQDLQAQAVAVAHTADDQVETVLLHLLRGSGLTGLTGMAYYLLPNAWSREIPLIRPLLSTWRQEIDAFIRENDLSPNIDRSNFDTNLLRNRVRQELLPYLQTYNPQVKRLLWQMAEILSDEENLIDEIVERAWEDCFIVKFSDQVELNARSIRLQKINIQRRLARRAISLLIPSLRDIDFGIIERFLFFCHRSKNYLDADLGEGLHLSKQGDRVAITRGLYIPDPRMPQLETEKVIPIDAPGVVLLSPTWQLHVELVPLDDIQRKKLQENSDPFQLWLDAEELNKPLLLRARKKGDSFCPLGMNGQRIKLSDYMINLKISRTLRAKWPLLLSNTEIVWVVGKRAGHYCRISEKTKNSVHLRLERIPDIEL